MIDPVTLRIWSFRCLFVGFCILNIFLHLLPFDLSAGRWPGPDWVLLLAFCWVLRRPSFVPTIVVAFCILVTNMLFLGPPGLWTALCVIGLEFLRTREPSSRDLPFLVEWSMVAGVLVAMTLIYRFILFVFVVDQPVFGLSMIGLAASCLCYPIVVALSRFAAGIHKITPGEIDKYGHSL